MAMTHTLTKLKVILNSGVDSVVMRVIRLSSGSIFMFDHVCARVYDWIFIEFVDSRLLHVAGKMPGQFNPLLRKYNIAFNRLVFFFFFLFRLLMENFDQRFARIQRWKRMRSEREKENQDNPSNKSKFSHVQKTKTEIEPNIGRKSCRGSFLWAHKK